MNVVGGEAEVTAIRGTFTCDGNGFVAPLEHMATALMPCIPPLAKGAHQIAHSIHEIGFRNFQ